MTGRGYLLQAWLVVCAGTGVTLFLSLVPMISIGYRLRMDILLAGLLPYAVYGVVAWEHRTQAVPLIGALVIAGEIWVVGRVDVQPHAIKDDDIVYLWSVLTTAAVVLAFWAAYRLGRRSPGNGPMRP